MGWVTNINLDEDLDFHGCKAEKGHFTQVRWDIGIGDINIGADGKIRDVSHLYPFEYDLETKKAYEENLLTFTGIFDAAGGHMHFHKGEWLNADLFNGSYLDSYVMNQLYAANITYVESFKYPGHEQGKNLDCSVSEEDGEKLKLALEDIRKQLDDGIVHQHPSIDPAVARIALEEYRRKGPITG